jgi:perosamine synthetase
MNSQQAVYAQAVTQTFKFYKDAQDIQQAYLRSIPIEAGGYLLPVCPGIARQSGLLEDLTNWRNEFVHVFPTQFEATLESTTAWYTQRLLDVPDRILFLVVDSCGNRVGHMGFNSCINDAQAFEIDNVIRGRESEKGLFSRALLALMKWAKMTVNVEQFYLRVFLDNAHAIGFYEKCGFQRTEEVALTHQTKGSTTSYVPAQAGQPVTQTFLRMDYRQDTSSIGKSMILTAGPSISARESVYAFDAATYGWNSQWSKYLTRLEKQFAEYTGAKYAMATSSCTGALHIALLALDIGVGDEVIVPDQTWVATANAVRYVGAKPVFADIELDTWNIDVNSVERLITSKTKAIVPVHMYGHPARMDGLLALAKSRGLHIVEDAAPAIGAEWGGKRCGSFGSFAAFSFQGAKLLVTGEGGMLVTNDDALYAKALKIWDQGRNPSKTFWIDDQGVKYKMSNVQAAIGLGQLERVDELIQMKRRIFSWYKEGLSGVQGLSLNEEVHNAKSIYWMTSIRLDESLPIARDTLISRLKLRNVDTRPVFPAISQYPIWGYTPAPQPVALRVGSQAMNLPSGVGLSKDHIMFVCQVIREELRLVS